MGPDQARPRPLTRPGIHDAPSPNQEPRPPGTPVDTLVLHYTGMRSAADAIARLRDPDARVSSHYVVEEDGTVWRLVAEDRRAAHAGVSFWRGHTGLNDRSVGIEIVNPGHEWGYRPFPAAQMAAVRDLCRGILARWPVPARNVVAHSDVAPSRKDDPGELFDWRWLAEAGVGLWPGAAEVDDPLDAPALLRAIGYDPGEAPDVLLRAFQRHWAPEAITGTADARTLSALRRVARAAG